MNYLIFVVKEFYELCVTREKPQYFDVNVICKVV